MRSTSSASGSNPTTSVACATGKNRLNNPCRAPISNTRSLALPRISSRSLTIRPDSYETPHGSFQIVNVDFKIVANVATVTREDVKVILPDGFCQQIKKRRHGFGVKEFDDLRSAACKQQIRQPCPMRSYHEFCIVKQPHLRFKRQVFQA